MWPIIITLIVIFSAIFLLGFTKLRPDLIALMVLLALGLTGVVRSGDIFSGFSNSAVMTILGISMISVALQQTGAANAIGRMIFKFSRHNETLTIFLVTVSSAVLSLFMNNIAAVGVLMPAVMSLSRKSQTAPAKLLIPLAYGTILGGMATLLTTSNIIVSGALKASGLPGFGLLDYFPVGAPVVVVGILYLVTVGRKLLPRTNPGGFQTTPRTLAAKLGEFYNFDKNLHHYKILPGSPLIDQQVFSSLLCSIENIQILRLIGPKFVQQLPDQDAIFKAGNVVMIRGELEPANLENLKVESIPPSPNATLVDARYPLIELILTPHSSLNGKTLREINFRARYGLTVLGIWRQGNPILEKVSAISLQPGDALLVQGTANHIHQIKGDPDLILLEEDPDIVPQPKKLALALLITLATLTFAALDIFPVPLVVLAGVVLLLLTGCMKMNDALQRIEWKAIFLIAGMWPLTIAIRETGLAANLTEGLLTTLGTIPPLAVAAVFLFLSMLFTQFLSGPVAPLIIIPLALAAAKNYGIDPQPLALAVALGCSLGFISPLGHPVNIMVMNPGGYTFKDFFRVGLPLTLLAFFTILAGLHFIWGL